MDYLTLFVRVLSPVLGFKHAEDDRVESGAMVGAALTERSLMHKSDVLEHIPRVSVVFGNIYPRSVQTQLIEDVIEKGDRRRRAVTLVP